MLFRSRDEWMPDYVVGLTRGGLAPANMISQYLDIPMHTLRVSLRDSDSAPESNLWMSEDAFGYDSKAWSANTSYDQFKARNILIVDDINDSGATLDWIRKDWQSSCLPEHDRWKSVWNQNVKFAVLVNNEASEFKNIDYVGHYINKHNDDAWIVFPWEQWWK